MLHRESALLQARVLVFGRAAGAHEFWWTVVAIMFLKTWWRLGSTNGEEAKQAQSTMLGWWGCVINRTLHSSQLSMLIPEQRSQVENKYTETNGKMPAQLDVQTVWTSMSIQHFHREYSYVDCNQYWVYSRHLHVTLHENPITNNTHQQQQQHPLLDEFLRGQSLDGDSLWGRWVVADSKCNTCLKNVGNIENNENWNH